MKITKILLVFLIPTGFVVTADETKPFNPDEEDGEDVRITNPPISVGAFLNLTYESFFV